jgi:hypothetical protein
LKVISSQVIGMFLSNQCRKIAEQRLPDRFLRGDFGQFFDSGGKRRGGI